MVVPAHPLTPPSRPLPPIRGSLRRIRTGWADWTALLAGIPILAGIALLSDPPPAPPAPPSPPPPPPPNPPAPPAPSDHALKAVIDSFAAANKAGAEQVEKVIADLRNENAGHRTTNQTLKGEWAKLAEAVGLKKDATADEVVAKFGEGMSTVRTVKVDRAIEQAAAKHKVDPELTAALLLKDKVTEGVEEDKLVEVLDAKVAEYAKERPNIRLAPPRRSGPPIDPADPDNRPQGLSAVIGRRMGIGA